MPVHAGNFNLINGGFMKNALRTLIFLFVCISFVAGNGITEHNRFGGMRFVIGRMIQSVNN